MSRRNALHLLIAILTIAGIVIVLQTVVASDDNGTRSPDPIYVGDPSNSCAGLLCHDEKIANWSATDHADADGDFQNKYGTNVYNDSDCGPCHTLGWNEVELGGFNTSQEWNSTHNQKMWMIQCENCHGPASEHSGGVNINIDRDPYTSCWGHGESACHSGLRQFGYEIGIPGWNQSAHAPYDNPIDDSGLNTYCAECKSPSQWDPEAGYGEGEEIPLEDWRGITCGDCHNPHNVTPYAAQLRWSPEETCDECHNESRHESLRTEHLAGTPSVDIEDYPYMEEVECVECHMYDTGRDIPEQWTTVGHSFEATIEACIWCHTDVYDNLPKDDVGEVLSYNETNATIVAAWEAWNVTLQEALDEWGGVVEAQQDRYETQHAEVEALYEEAEDLKEIAEENGTWTDALDELFDQAEYDFSLAEHNSEGSHNPAYTTALFQAAEEGFEEIIEELSMGTLKGKVTDSPGPLADVYITAGDMGTKTAADGTYTLMLEPGTYTVTAFKEGTIEHTFSDVVVSAAAITWQNFTLADDFDKDGTSDADDTDDDNDGLPDEWETNNGLNPKDSTDASADGDGDGMTNLQEYKDDKDPQVADKEEAEEEEAEITLYLAVIVVLIIIVIILGMMVAKKGGGAPVLPPETEEPKEEAPLEEEYEEEEELEEET